MHQQHMFKSNY